MGVLKLAVFVSRTEVLVESHTHSFSTNSLSLIEVALMMKVPIAFQLLPIVQMEDPFTCQSAS